MEKLSIQLSRLKERTKSFKKEIKALYLAYKRPDTPWYAKLVIILVVGYSLSPIDLIPDFIPVLGYLDDLVLIPLGVALAIKILPPDILNECRMQAENLSKDAKPKNWIAGTVIILIWVAVLWIIVFKFI